MNLQHLVEDMIQYKVSLGRKRSTYETHLKDLSASLDKECTPKETLSVQEDVLPWCSRRAKETPAGLRRRMAAAREFTKYLHALGLCDGILSLEDLPRVHRFVPYIFSDSELTAVFDAWKLKKEHPHDPFAVQVIRVIYPLIYFCGLRPNEGRELRRNDFLPSDRTLFIRHNKAGRERILPMADDMANCCEEFLELRDSLRPDSEWFFPAPDGNPYSAKWLGRHFQRLWHLAFPESRQAVRVYDLRHRFATAVLAEWLDRGEDLFAVMPYLSAYMGHSSFSSTVYYVHLLPERLLKSAAIDWERIEAMMPEVEWDE